MADFCMQCATAEGWSTDLADLQTIAETQAGMATEAICEGCGFTLVDHTGRCVMKGCLEKHNP